MLCWSCFVLLPAKRFEIDFNCLNYLRLKRGLFTISSTFNSLISVSCDAPVNHKTGAEAKNWKNSHPIRVLRSHKGSVHSIYAPEYGIRYDGIYRIVSYSFVTGKSGLKVWRFLFRRDDPA